MNDMLENSTVENVFSAMMIVVPFPWIILADIIEKKERTRREKIDPAFHNFIHW